MSSEEFQETSRPEIDADAENLPGPSGIKNLDRNVQPIEQQPSSSDDSKGYYSEPAACVSSSPSTSQPKAKAEKSSNIAKPAPFKAFPEGLLELPLTKEQIAASLTLEEACGFLPHLMKKKRYDLQGKELEVDQISVDLQLALNEAKNICILLEKSTREEPNDILSARILAQKLNYQLSASYSVFQKLDRLGKALKEHIDSYSKHSGDYHSTVDILLDYIVENILEKCRQLQTMMS